MHIILLTTSATCSMKILSPNFIFSFSVTMFDVCSKCCKRDDGNLSSVQMNTAPIQLNIEFCIYFISVW